MRAALLLQIKPWQLARLLVVWIVVQLAAGVATMPLGLVKRKESPSAYWLILTSELAAVLLTLAVYRG
ncbi:hypothetical protein [Candidatus Korobacter versatilis]|uniref:hypothetical protein n=1 Tax=Candidatus Korobacter versatilis TaxID=658062 RepID=UPI000307C4B1|nr:hypothetical protein [Candidatus Koribacter versatilis]